MVCILFTLPISSGAFPTNLLRARWISQIIAGSITLSLAAGISHTSSRHSSFVASTQCSSCSIVSSQRSCGLISQTEFDGGGTEQVLDVVGLLMGVLSLYAVGLGTLGVWGELVPLDGLEQPEKLDRLETLNRLDGVETLDGLETRLNGLEILDGLETRLNGLETLDRLETTDTLETLDRLETTDTLETLDRLETTDTLETIDSLKLLDVDLLF